MKIDKETQEKIQELQEYEQNLHSLLMQKQAFQIELIETETALVEIVNSKEDIFKIIGNIMIKTEKKRVEDELKRKKELFSLRLKSIESQEKELTNKTEEIKKEIMKKIK